MAKNNQTERPLMRDYQLAGAHSDATKTNTNTPGLRQRSAADKHLHGIDSNTSTTNYTVGPWALFEEPCHRHRSIPCFEIRWRPH
jgi:hypothetical protein